MGLNKYLRGNLTIYLISVTKVVSLSLVAYDFPEHGPFDLGLQVPRVNSPMDLTRNQLVIIVMAVALCTAPCLASQYGSTHGLTLGKTIADFASPAVYVATIGIMNTREQRGHS